MLAVPAPDVASVPPPTPQPAPPQPDAIPAPPTDVAQLVSKVSMLEAEVQQLRLALGAAAIRTAGPTVETVVSQIVVVNAQALAALMGAAAPTQPACPAQRPHGVTPSAPMQPQVGAQASSLQVSTLPTTYAAVLRGGQAPAASPKRRCPSLAAGAERAAMASTFMAQVDYGPLDENGCQLDDPTGAFPLGLADVGYEYLVLADLLALIRYEDAHSHIVHTEPLNKARTRIMFTVANQEMARSVVSKRHRLKGKPG